MSQENLDAFNRSTDAFKRQDFDAWMAELDSDVEWHSALPALLTVGDGVYRGREAVRGMFRELDDTLDELTVEYSEIRDFDDRVLGIGRIHTRGAASGVTTESPFALLAEYKNGKSTRVRTFLDPDEAIEAANKR
jgi:ketosteroid isomerase-like protein